MDVVSPSSCASPPSALGSNGPGGERAHLRRAPALHREEVQRSQGDDLHTREDHGDAGGNTARPHGGGDHSPEEEAQRPGQALTHRRPHPLSAGEPQQHSRPKSTTCVVRDDKTTFPILVCSFYLATIARQSWQSLSGPSGYEDLNNISVAPYYSFDATKRAIASLKLQVEEISKTELSKISGTGRNFFLMGKRSICSFELSLFCFFF